MAATPLYLLDTDHVSLLQRGNLAIAAHLQQQDPQQCAVSVITVAEQMQGRLAQIHALRSESDAPLRFRLLQATLLFYREITILPIRRKQPRTSFNCARRSSALARKICASRR